MMEDFEKEIRKYFQQRQIQPSEKAWDKMKALLEEQKPEQKKAKIMFYFLSVAASVILLLGLWQFFKNSQQFPEEHIEQTIFATNDSIVPKQETIEENRETIADQTVKEHSVRNEKQKTIVSQMIAEKPVVIETKIPKESEKVLIESSVVKPKKVTEDIKEVYLAVAHPSVEIKVNPQRLLQSAEIERQIENATTEGQNFWKKVGEKHNLVQNYK